MNWSSCKK